MNDSLYNMGMSYTGPRTNFSGILDAIQKFKETGEHPEKNGMVCTTYASVYSYYAGIATKDELEALNPEKYDEGGIHLIKNFTDFLEEKGYTVTKRGDDGKLPDVQIGDFVVINYDSTDLSEQHIVICVDKNEDGKNIYMDQRTVVTWKNDTPPLGKDEKGNWIPVTLAEGLDKQGNPKKRDYDSIADFRVYHKD